MTDITKPLLGAALGLGAVSLLSRGARGLSSGSSTRKSRKRARRSNQIGLATDLLVGTALLGGAASMLSNN